MLREEGAIVASSMHHTYMPKSPCNIEGDDFDIMNVRYGASFGRICYGIKGAYNVALIKVVPVRDHVREFLRAFLMTDAFYNGLQAIGDGKSAREGFSKDELKLLSVAFPGLEALVLHAFEKTGHSLLRIGFGLKQEIQLLQSLTNVLLARMSRTAG